jgi:hypothetical protein
MGTMKQAVISTRPIPSVGITFLCNGSTFSSTPSAATLATAILSTAILSAVTLSAVILIASILYTIHFTS